MTICSRSWKNYSKNPARNAGNKTTPTEMIEVLMIRTGHCQVIAVLLLIRNQKSGQSQPPPPLHIKKTRKSSPAPSLAAVNTTSNPAIWKLTSGKQLIFFLLIFISRKILNFLIKESNLSYPGPTQVRNPTSAAGLTVAGGSLGLTS